MKTKLKDPNANGRYIENIVIGQTPITLIKQSNNKLDNALLDFSNQQFDINVLLAVYDLDSCNCYPYIVLTDAVAARSTIDKFSTFKDLVYVYDTTHSAANLVEMMSIMSMAKGVSKGLNASRSHELDDRLLSYVKKLAHQIDVAIEVTHPREKNLSNEDLRMTYNGVQFFRQENKRISEIQNITERVGMVGGKALISTGNLDDLFVSFIGFDKSFISVLGKASGHFAKAYVEFTLDEQALIRLGDETPFKTKHVLVPTDINDITKGVIESVTLEEFYKTIMIEQVT